MIDPESRSRILGGPDSVPPPVTLGRGGIVSLLFASTFIIMVGCVVAPTLPSISAHLGMERHAGWLVTLPSLGVVLFGPVAGWAAKRKIYSRSAMLAGLLAYGIFGIAAPWLAQWPALVVADRLLLGGSTALILYSSTDLVASFFDGPKRLQMIAYQGMATETGGIVLLAIGGVLGALNWRLPFLLYSLAFSCFVCILIAIPKPPPHELQAAAGGSGRESSGVRIVFLSATLSMMLFFIAILTLPGILAGRMHYGPAQTGYVLSYISLCAVVGISLMPRTFHHIRASRLQCLAFALFGAAHLLFAASSSVPGLLAAGALMGCAFAASIPLASHLIVELSPIAMRARNLGYLSTSIFLGQVLSSFAGYISSSGERVILVTGLAALTIGAGYWVHEQATSGLRGPVKAEDGSSRMTTSATHQEPGS
jgi:predicted MFS family arabinose efflux permease